jgi:hypothetical protein
LINSTVLKKNPVELRFSKNEVNKMSDNDNFENNQENTNYTITRRNSETGELIPFEKERNNERVDYKKIMYIYDEKEISREDFEKIDASIIASVSVLKSDNAIEKYGEKGKNGVIEIKSLKYLEQADPIHKEITNNKKERKEAELNAKQNSNLSEKEIQARQIERNKLIEERKKVLEERKSEIKKEFDKRKETLEKRKKVVAEKRKKHEEEGK